MSVRLSCGVYQHGLSGNLILGTKVRRETSDLVKIRQHYRAVYFGQQYEVVCSSAAVKLDPILAFPWQHSAVLYCWQLYVGQQRYKGNVLLRFHGNIKLNSFILLTATCRSTAIPPERIVAFPWQHSTVLDCWQLHVGHIGNILLRFHGNSGHANTPLC
jgi:hypothetical protein